MVTDYSLPLFIEPDQVDTLLDDPQVILVDLCKPELYAQLHIPGAIQLPYSTLIAGTKPAPGLLPATERLMDLCRALGIREHSTVIAYDDEGGGAAARLVWTLHVMGFFRASVINGGIHAWANEGHRLEQQPAHPRNDGNLVYSGQPGPALVNREYLLQHLDDGTIQLFDSRTQAEFNGTRAFAARGGHIPGALNLDWNDTKDQARNLRLKADAELHGMLDRLGIDGSREIVTYCQTHHRSSHTYLMLLHLGFPRVSGYAGAWAEWGNDPSLPLEI